MYFMLPELETYFAWSPALYRLVYEETTLCEYREAYISCLLRNMYRIVSEKQIFHVS